MISVNRTFSGLVIIIPTIIGAYLSGMVYLAEGAAIPLSAFQIALVIAVGIFIFRKIASKELSFYFYGLEMEYLVFLAIIFFSLIYSPERDEGLFDATRYIVLIGLTYLIYNSVNTLKELKIICYATVFAACVVAIPSLVESILNPEVAAFNYINEGKKIIRSSGAERDPNIFGSNFILPIMLLVAFIGEAKRNKKKIILFCISGILIGAVLLTYSRSTWVALFFGITIIILYQRKFDFIIYGFIVLAIVFLGSEGVRNIVFSVGDRVVDIFAGTSEDSSRFRLILLETSIYMWLDSYTFGIGYQGFSTVFQEYHPPQEVGGVYEPHNEFYKILAELGLIGFLVYLFILWKTLKIGWNSVKNYQKERKSTAISLALFASFFAYIIFFQFLGGMQLHSILTINIGLLFCASKFVGKSEETELAV